MPDSNIITQLALRAAANGQHGLISATSHVDEIKNAALERAKALVGGITSSQSTVKSQLDLQTQAIELAIGTIVLSYTLIQGGIRQLKDKRLAFDKECNAGIASFIIPTNKEISKLSKHEQIIKALNTLINKNPSFAPYFGIQSSTLAEMSHAEFYSVLPLYRMSKRIAQPVTSHLTIDQQRVAINLFFITDLNSALQEIDKNFFDDVSFVEFFKSAIERENYLNNLRSQRFVMMILGNLLWNLQHPVDPHSGFPLGAAKVIQICREIELFLNKLVNESDPAYVEELSNEPNQLLGFVRKVKTHTKALRRAFVEEHLHELNVNDLMTSAHHTLRIMDTTLFKLFYSHTDPITKKEQPDKLAAQKVAYKMGYLNQKIIAHPELNKTITPFSSYAKGTPYFNNPPITLIDVLITFVHCPKNKKKNLIEALKQDKSVSAEEVVELLTQFNKQFIHPIEQIICTELGVDFWHNDQDISENVARQTARRLVPLITLVLEDFRVQVDNPRDDQRENNTYRSSEQMSLINKQAEQGHGYYQWVMSTTAGLSKEMISKLNQLPKHQYRFTQISQLLDCVSEIVQNYRTFLQFKVFQDFLINCLNKIQNEYNALTEMINRMDDCLNQDKGISRNMEDILGQMAGDLTGSLKDFTLAFSSFEQVIRAPNFSEQQKLSLSAKLNAIHSQFLTLFNEDSGLATFFSPTQPLLHPVDNAEINPSTLSLDSTSPSKGLNMPQNTNALTNPVPEINMSDLSDEAHKAVQATNNALFSLVYPDLNWAIHKVPAAEGAKIAQLKALITRLQQDIIDNPDALPPFASFGEKIKASPYLNPTPSTYMDVLIIFTHCTHDEREQLFKTLKSKPKLIQDLNEFDSDFIKPIKHQIKSDRGITLLDYDVEKRKGIATLTAKCLIPLITLALNDFKVTTKAAVPAAAIAQPPVTNPALATYDTEQQIKGINELATQGGGYYTWQLPPFVLKDKSKRTELNQLPERQYHFIQIIHLLDAVNHMLQKAYPSSLAHTLHAFLFRFINQVINEFKALTDQVTNSAALIGCDAPLNKDQPLNKKLSLTLNNLTTLMSSDQPQGNDELNDSERNAFSAVIQAINTLCISLFKTDSGLHYTPPPKPPIVEPKNALGEQIQTEKEALVDLTKKCHQALSSGSKSSEKGVLLMSLISLIQSKKTITPDDISHTIKELARITLSYHINLCFFHAPYAETRSAKIFIAALKNPALNAKLSISQSIFGDGVNVNKDSEQRLFERLRQVREENNWPESSDQIVGLNAF